MKKKNLNGLRLNKRTVSELNESTKNMIKGGSVDTTCGYASAVQHCATNKYTCICGG